MVAASWWTIGPLVVLGSILHFVYDWSDHNRFVALIGAVNESYWEHVKIAVWRVALFQATLFALGGHQFPSFIPASAVSLYSIAIGMIGLVFLYKSVTKRNVLVLDIGAFALVMILAHVIFINLVVQLHAELVTIVLSSAYLAGLIVSFLHFTLRPPREPDVFIDPITKGYGVGGHAEPPRGDDDRGP